MDIRDYPTKDGPDLGDTIVHVCFCGNRVFKIFATFSDFNIATYSTSGECIQCGARFKVPTEADRPQGD